MKRLIVGACAVAFSALPAVGPTPVAAPVGANDVRSLPMQFTLRREGPAEACGQECRTWVSATGAITSDTPREFETLSKRHDLQGATIALDSDGGSVLGALSLGRMVRKLGMTTTVGKTVDLPVTPGGERRAKLLPRAYCESMCAFVLLAGVERHVPPGARVMVHQIWLGDRRDDPTAANYSAEDLVLVQRDIGRLAQYTVEMGGTIDLLETALKIPPWEPMRLLSREELRGMKIVTKDPEPEIVSNATATSIALASGARAPINERSWVIGDRGGRPTLSRSHPLTVEGEDMGTFELVIGCGEPGRNYRVTYVERRRRAAGRSAPEALTEVDLSLGGRTVPLKIEHSRPSSRVIELESIATGTVPVEVLRTFAESRSRSLTIETTSDDTDTVIRLGNAGIARSFVQLAATCLGQPGLRNASRGGLRREAEAQPR